MAQQDPRTAPLAPTKDQLAPTKDQLARTTDREGARDDQQSLRRAGVAQALGLHPLVAFGMFACDWMLFGGEAGTAGIGLALTIPIALALAIPSVLIQRFSFGDRWGAAIGKGVLVGVLTAIPFPIGSPVTLAGGALGLLRPKKRAGSGTSTGG